MIAAMKNVLSPISETRITEKLAMKAWMNPRFEPFGGSSVVTVSSVFFRSVGGFTSSSSSFGAKSPTTNRTWLRITTASKANVRSLLIDELAILQLWCVYELLLKTPIALIFLNAKIITKNFSTAESEKVNLNQGKSLGNFRSPAIG